MAQQKANNSNTTGLLLTPAQIASLPPGEQATRMQAMSPAEQQLVAAEQKNMKEAANRHFLRKSFERVAYCPAAGSSANTQTYTSGTTLTYNFPVIGGAYVRGILIRFSIPLTFAAGTGAAYALSQSAPYTIFSEIDVLLNGKQVYTNPNIIPVLEALAGYAKYPQLNGVPANLPNIAAINTFEGVSAPAAGTISNTFNGAVTGSTTWVGQMYLPLNAIASDAVPGLLPAHGVGNTVQVRLVCNNQLLGNDPYLSPVYSSAGTAGWGVTVTNTGATNYISCDIIYSDGSTMSDPNGVAIDITNTPTLQYNIDTPLNPLTSGNLVRQHINTLLEHVYVISFVIDGNQAGQFSTIANIQQLQLSADSIGRENFLDFNVSNNIPVSDYYDRLVRRVHGQDLPQGVIVWVDAPGRGTVDPDDRRGIQTLNMRPGGYPAATHAYYLGSVGGYTPVDTNPKAVPRVETLLVSLNDEGLKLMVS